MLVPLSENNWWAAEKAVVTLNLVAARAQETGTTMFANPVGEVQVGDVELPIVVVVVVLVV